MAESPLGVEVDNSEQKEQRVADIGTHLESAEQDGHVQDSSEAETIDGREPTQNQMSGWLMKRGRISRKWKKRWFQLKKTELFYGKTEKETPKKISLEAAEISETSVDHKKNAFRIKPKDAKRVYYLHAENDTVQNSWMQAICFAKAASRTDDQSQACVIQ